jgi:hypothetical protein
LEICLRFSPPPPRRLLWLNRKTRAISYITVIKDYFHWVKQSEREGYASLLSAVRFTNDFAYGPAFITLEHLQGLFDNDDLEEMLALTYRQVY